MSPLNKILTIKVLKFIVFAATLAGVFFRFYNLQWGAPYFFHPDERNIASSVSQLSFPNQMNPHFFAYGSLPIYSIYFTGVLTNIVEKQLAPNESATTQVKFESAILIGRIFSSIFSVLIVFLMYGIGKKAFGETAGLVCVLLTSLSIGFIQYAHFATFEMWLSLFTVVLCSIALKYSNTPRFIYLIVMYLVIGILISIKVSSIVLLIIPITLIAGKRFDSIKNRVFSLRRFFQNLIASIVLASITILVVIITSPFFVFAYDELRGALQYESSVGLGTLPVFYTQAFTNTIPIVYQLAQVYPFILNPITLIIFLVTLPLIVYRLAKTKNEAGLIILFFFLLTFLSQAFLYVKWTRYYIPTLPFIYLLLSSLFNANNIPIINTKFKSIVLSSLFILLTCSSFLFAFSFFKTAYVNKDTRVEAANWASQNISNDTPILSEVYDMGIVPFNPYFSQIRLINFYDIESIPDQYQEFKTYLNQTEYIILPSQRITQTRLASPHIYLKGGTFYHQLFNNREVYELTYKTPCDFFCNILYLGDPSLFYEQTAYVFDRPQVFIFKKIR